MDLNFKISEFLNSVSGSWKMSHPRLPEISQISGLPHHPADSQHCKICQISKISREWEHRDLEWKQSVNYVNEKTFWLVYVVRWVRSLMLVGRCQWPWNSFKMLSMASSKSWIQTNRIHSVHDGIKIQLSMPDFDWSRKIQIISDEVDAFRE